MLRSDIQAAKNATTFKIGIRREMRRLENNLYPGETVERVVSGRYKVAGRGVLVLTDRRVLFLKDGWFRKFSQDFSFRAVHGIEWQGMLFMGSILLSVDSTDSYDGVITKVFKGEGERMVKAIRMKVSQWANQNGSGYYPPQQPQHAPATASVPVQSAPQQDGIAEQLDKLVALRNLGRISDAEYESARNKLLS